MSVRNSSSSNNNKITSHLRRSSGVALPASARHRSPRGMRASADGHDHHFRNGFHPIELRHRTGD
jgi:hypothetical protein